MKKITYLLSAAVATLSLFSCAKMLDSVEQLGALDTDKYYAEASDPQAEALAVAMYNTAWDIIGDYGFESYTDNYVSSDPYKTVNNDGFGSSDAIHPMGCHNVTIRNCSFFFIGGTIQLDFGEWRDYYTRMGNSITNYGACDGMVVENCYFDQAYDTAVSTQTVHNEITRNVVYRNNVMQNVWFGVELWAGDSSVKDLEFRYIDVSGNYCRKIGEGLCTTRPDKVDPGTDYSVNAFIKISHAIYQMEDVSVTDNVSDGTTGKFVYCSQPKTSANPQNGALFARNVYIGTQENDFIVLPSAFPEFNPVWDSGTRKYRLNTKKYPYSRATVDLIQSNGFETDSVFYYTDSAASFPQYTYKAANGIELPFRLAFPDSYRPEDRTYSLITFFNQEDASGTDNLSNVTVSSNVISALSSGQDAVLLIPQCPSGTWTGLAVDNGNYSTASVAETAVMKAVSAMIRDVAVQFKTGRNYAVGIDAGAYAVSDLLARHKNLLAAGIVIAGAGDPSADIGNAKVWVIHASGDDVIPQENAEALAEAWNAEYTCYEWGSLHDCWNEAVKKEDLLDWLLSK